MQVARQDKNITQRVAVQAERLNSATSVLETSSKLSILIVVALKSQRQQHLN